MLILFLDWVGIYTLGKPGLEQYFKHATPVTVMKMQFIINKVNSKLQSFDVTVIDLTCSYNR